MKKGTVLILSFFLFANAVHAGDVPHQINYQGYITSGGSGYNSTGYFKLKIVNASGTGLGWSNDNTHTEDTTIPDSATSTTCSSGVFNITLGDTSLPSMPAIPTTIFNTTDTAYLRVWFSTDNTNFEQLSPDKRITSSAYAYVSGSVKSEIQNAVVLGPYHTHSGDTGEIRCLELADGSDYVGFKAPDTISSNAIWTLPSTIGTSGQFLKVGNSGALSWDTPAGSGANTTLSNLTDTVAINKSLIASGAEATYDLGSSAISWKDIYTRTVKFDGSTSGTTTVQASPAAGTTTLTLPAADDTLVGKTTPDVLTNKTLTSPDINGGTWNGTIDSSWTAASQTCANLGTVTTADINGGTWQGTIDGSWTAASQTCTNLGTVTTADINGGTVDSITSLTVANNVDIGAFDLRAATITPDGLISGRVTFATTNGQLTDDTDLTFATDTLTATKITSTQLSASSSSGLGLYDDAGSGIFIEDGGEVGIGIASPNAALQVNGVVTANNITDNLLYRTCVRYVSATSVKVLAGTTIKIGARIFYLLSDSTLTWADLDTGSEEGGKDYHIFAYDNSGTLVLKIHKTTAYNDYINTNAEDAGGLTYPTGYTSTYSRVIGGFHNNATDTSATAGDILQYSVWDLKNRPSCPDPRGMVKSMFKKVWYDIYLPSAWNADTQVTSMPGSDPYNQPTYKVRSVYQGTIWDTMTWYYAQQRGHNSGKRLLMYDEFIDMATGTPETQNITGGADPVTTGGHTGATAGTRLVSAIGAEDCAGVEPQ